MTGMRIRTCLNRRRLERAFTLVEMLVALAVLIVAMAVVTTVFGIAAQTASQTTAVAEVQSLLRAWMLQVEQDLAAVDPTGSIMVIHGRTLAAARTAEDLAAGRFLRFLVGDPNRVPAGFRPEFDRTSDPNVTQYSDPRADILMFFSMRPTSSQAPPANVRVNDPNFPYASGSRFTPIQVVYGHAAIDEAELVDRDSRLYRFADRLRHISQWVDRTTQRSVLPATRWHLARRVVILEPYPSTGGRVPEDHLLFDGSATGSANDPAKDRPYPRILRLDNTQNIAGDVARLDFTEYLRRFGKDFGYGSGAPRAASLRPYEDSNWRRGGNPGLNQLVFSLLGPRGAGDFTRSDGSTTGLRHVATILEEPPANLQGNLGLHALPACAWFQVEFLMPEDPRNGRDYFDPSRGTRNRPDDTLRWVEVKPDSTYVFVPDTQENREIVASQVDSGGKPLIGPNLRLGDFALADPSGENTVVNRRVRMWPYAIRLTVRVYDRGGRLRDPIERSIVHRFD